MLSACGDPSDSSSGAAEPVSQPVSQRDVTLTDVDDPAADPQSPMEPPSTPSDPQPVDQVAGRVVRGGAGPCYGVETDDGKLYAVHSPSTGELEVGTTVLVKLGPNLPDVDCGDGEPVTASRIDVVG